MPTAPTPFRSNARLPFAESSTSRTWTASSRSPFRLALLGLCLIALLAAPGCEDANGITDFVSADATGGADARLGLPMASTDLLYADASVEAGSDAPAATVEEGDIYRVLSGSLILNLNTYRGLQIIDFSDVEHPEVIGRYEVSGTPVELYVIGDRAIVLLNDWQGYSWYRGPSQPQRESGGIVLSIDLSDPSNPVLLDRVVAKGHIQKSRLVRRGEQAAVYVAGGGWELWPTGDGDWVWEDRSIVKSYDVSGEALVARDTIDLGGYVVDIAATAEALMVARRVYYRDLVVGGPQSHVSIVDISDPAGHMTLGDEVPISGLVESQFNMDLHEGVLRVVSSSTWADRTNYLETFDASDLGAIEPIDRVAFGDSQQLFATIFLGNKAFFVTYLRVDPFHAFAIDDDGFAREVSEFVVSGWNDFFRPVFDATRLVGIGIDDANGWHAAVSLYDIEDLANPDPLIARAEIDGSASWGEARWDHRAFSVLEDSVEAVSPEGTPETGLILLPFNAWGEAPVRYGVQIYTFSETTLTLRGAMDHGSPVRRSFQADEAITANLSMDAISFFDTELPDEPVELGRLGLAVNFRDFFPFGAYGARVLGSTGYEVEASDRVEIVSLSEHPDGAETLASFEVPAGAELHQVGDLLVALSTRWVTDDEKMGEGHNETTIDVHDLSDPLTPKLSASIVTDRIGSSPYWYDYGYRGGPIMLMSDVALPYFIPYSWNRVQVVDGALAFLQSRYENVDIVPLSPECVITPDEPADAAGGTPGAALSYNAMMLTTESSVAPRYGCYETRIRYSLEVLDLTDASAPAFAESAIDLEDGSIGLTMLGEGSDLWLSLRRPTEPDDEGRAQTRFFIQRIDLGTPRVPLIGPEVSVPGELLAIEGAQVFTRDTQWSEDGVVTAVARLELFGEIALLRAKRLFENQWVRSVMLDGAGHIVMDLQDRKTGTSSLSVLDAASDDLATLSDSPLDGWSTLKHAEAGRAILQAGSGILVFNLDDPAAPFAQAYFATRTWPGKVVVAGRQIIIPAHRYGIYAFDIDENSIPTHD